MNQEQKQSNTLATLRGALFHTIFDIRNGKMDARDGIAIAKLSNSAIDTYRTEIEAIKTMDSLKERNAKYGDALPALESFKNDKTHI